MKAILYWSLIIYFPYNSIGLKNADDARITYDGYKMLRCETPNRHYKESLISVLEDNSYTTEEQTGSISVWGEGPDSIDIALSPLIQDNVTQILTALQINYTVLIENLQEEIKRESMEIETHLNSTIERRLRRSTEIRATREDIDSIIGTYVSYDEIIDWLNVIEQFRSDIVRVEEIGRSSEGRPLLLVKIGLDMPNKPALWIDAGIHAREWIAPATALYFIHTLITGYQVDDSVTTLLHQFDWYILPSMNPDGYEFSRTTDRLWRKTRSGASHNPMNKCAGVDGNRNFDFHWRSGANTCTSFECLGADPCDIVYGGQRPFSEPETIAVASFIMNHRASLKLYITLHSYSQLWLTPWSYTAARPSDYAELLTKARVAVASLESVYGTKFEIGSSTEILYTATGTSADWAKGVAGIKYSYTIELRDKGRYGFFLPQSQILPTAEETWAGIKALVQEILKD